MKIFKTLQLIASFASIMSFVLAIIFVYYPTYIQVPNVKQEVLGEFAITTREVSLSEFSIFIGFVSFLLAIISLRGD